MKKIILIALCMMCIVGTASAYQLYLSLSGIGAGWHSVKMFD